MTTLGIDPGRTGAAAIVEGYAVVWRAYWRPRRAGGLLVDLWSRAQTRPGVHVARMSSVGAIIADAASHWVIDSVVVEDQHIGRRTGVKSALKLARTAGEVSAHTTAEHGGPVLWWGPRQWRPRVGIPSNTPSTDAKRWARDLVLEHTGQDVRLDEAEAICMAWAGEGVMRDA